MNGDLTLTHVHARAVSKMAAFFPAETGQFMDESRTRHNIFVDSRCDSYVLVASLNRSAASPGGEFARVFAVKSPAAPVDRTLLHDRNGTVRFFR
jgi:hypothetical protein